MCIYEHINTYYSAICYRQDDTEQWHIVQDGHIGSLYRKPLNHSGLGQANDKSGKEAMYLPGLVYLIVWQYYTGFETQNSIGKLLISGLLWPKPWIYSIGV